MIRTAMDFELESRCGLCESSDSVVSDSDSAPPQALGKVDHAKLQAAVRQMLQALGEDPDRDGLRDTPARVARAMAEMCSGLHDSPAVHLGRAFEQQSDQMILLRDIEFFSLCEHHLLPFIGRAHVAYLPAEGRVVGLSKLARTVEMYARRPQLQERLTSQVADALMEHAQARGAAVVIEAEHLCMKMRGVKKNESVMVTSALRGVFKNDPATRGEFMSFIQGSRRS